MDGVDTDRQLTTGVPLDDILYLRIFASRISFCLVARTKCFFSNDAGLSWLLSDFDKVSLREEIFFLLLSKEQFA